MNRHYARNAIRTARVSANRARRGVALLLHVLLLIVTVAFVGLAVDVGTLYMIKARLSSAVDGAALNAGRSVNLASSVTAANTAAQNTAQSIFTANFPAGYLNTSGSPTVTTSLVDETDSNGNPTGVLDIKVSASATAPTYFMGIFGYRNMTVAATSTAQRRGLVLMLVLDVSSSMNSVDASSTAGLTACQEMVSAAQNFITLFGPYDRIGLVTFDYTAHLKYAPSTSYGDGTLSTIIGNITCNNNTNTVSGMELAYRQLVNTGLPLAENEIVLFTDGSPNGISADFPVRTLADNRWSPSIGDPTGCPETLPGSANETMCTAMPVVCTVTTPVPTVTGTLVQESGQNSWGGSVGGLYQPIDTDPVPDFTPYCNTTGAGLQSKYIHQFVAYIPNQDTYHNSTLGIGPITATYATNPVTIVSNQDTRTHWLFQVNQLCIPSTTNCKFTGDVWRPTYSSTGTGSNFFPAGSSYAGYLRPDQPNSVVVASMNATMNEAFKIRNDSTYHPVIHTIYLTGNGGDAVDREFLPIVANTPTIPALPYDPSTYVPYANPVYQTAQEQGKYLVTARGSDLQGLFAQLASEVLRLSH